MQQSVVKLPAPKNYGDVSLESVLSTRRSRRNYLDRAIELHMAGQILWACYGINKSRRTCPSAGGIYPLIVYLVAGNIDTLSVGLYRYDPETHTLHTLHNRDIRTDLSSAAFYQAMLRDAPASLVYTGIYDPVASRYGERGIHRYIPMDIGHSAQNVYLQAEALGMGTCAVGAFHDERVKKVLGLPSREHPLYMMPIGYTSLLE